MVTLLGVTHRHPEILSGVPVFAGTRVPIRSLFDYLEGGDTLEEFLQLPETEPASEYIHGQINQKPMPQGEHRLLRVEQVFSWLNI